MDEIHSNPIDDNKVIFIQVANWILVGFIALTGSAFVAYIFESEEHEYEKEHREKWEQTLEKREQN